MEKSELRTLFESEYPGKKVIFENLIQPIFAKAKDATLTDNQILSDSDKKQIKSFSIIAQVRGGFPITFADVEVQDSVALKRSRVNIQNCVRKMLANDSNAIIFFHFTDDKKEWRVSYCHRATTNKESTDAKRFTYLCGTEHACRTIAERFDTLQGLSTIKDEDMLEAFGVEPLSKEFFDKYREHYADLVEYISGKRFVKKSGKFVEEKTKNANGAFKSAFDGDDKLVRDYVKKMMGRLVFLHFLQKKGWLGVPQKEAWGNGDKNFIYNLFNNADDSIKEDFLEQALEPLFFKTLNSDRGEDAIAPKAICDIYGEKVRIPYLNGGLFEEDDLDKKKVKFKKEHFEDLLDFFNQYNFTIDETDPDDQEIGVDPEMLGKIFENLLEDNKDKGAFYTPKEIVQYMCRESLIAYLDEKTGLDTRDFVINHTNQFTKAQEADVLDALLKVKVCDPAVGSGAFPMGMMNELLACTQLLIGEGKTRSQLKKHIVKNNIYGVDIEKGAVDIARLRFWLAIIVDENEPIPLPNLDYKIMQGNSLLECYEGIDLSHMLEVPPEGEFDYNEEQRTLLKTNMDEYFDDNSHEDKAVKNDIIKSLVYDLASATCGLKENSEKALQLHEKIWEGTPDFFLWHTWFNDVFNRPNDCNGFDIVIGNPPYIKEYTNKDAFDGFRENSPYYVGKMDLWYGFACHGLDLLRKEGVLCFIAQNNWTTSSGAKLMRKKVIEDSKILQMLDFNTYMIFENADIQTMVMLFQQNDIIDNYSFDYRILLEDAQKDDMLALLEKKSTPKTKYLTPKLLRENYLGKLLTFTENDSILDKIAKDKLYLTEEEVTQGIIGNPDNAFKVDDADLKLFNSNEKNLIHKFHTHTERYEIDDTDINIIYLSSKDNPDFDINKYPNIKKQLTPFSNELKNRREVLLGRFSWYFLHWPRKEETFKKGFEKIITQVRCEKPKFCYTTDEYYGSRALFFIQTKRWNMKMLLGILNSKLVEFWLRGKGKIQGAVLKLDKEPLLGIPLPKNVTENKEKMIVELVDKILLEKEKDRTTDISSYEEKIDNIVYELYGLSEEDINLIK